MSENQKFPVALHALAYLAHKQAFSPDRAVASAALAASMPTNPVVVRRVTGMLGKAGLIAARAGASGGAWLLKQPEQIRLDHVLAAVDGCAHLGVAPPGVRGCPVGERIPDAVRGVLAIADDAVRDRLSAMTLADLIADADRAAA